MITDPAIEIIPEITSPFKDNLTGVFTRDFFGTALEREIERAKRYDSSFTLAMVDVDGFEVFNEQNGTLKGNLLLRKIADAIVERLRQTDLVARYADGRFAILMADTEAAPARLVLERLQKSIAASMNNGITVCVGLAAWPQAADSKDGMIEITSAALEQAQFQGANTLFYFDTAKIVPGESGLPIVLLVDEEPLNLKLMEALMVSLKYHVLKATNGLGALEIISCKDVDMVLLDVTMSAMDGFELCRRIKAKESTRMIPVVLVTALDDSKSKIKGIESGADDFIAKPPNLAELKARTKSLIQLKKLNNNLASIETVLISLANTVEAKCAYTQGHISRVSNMAVQLGRKLGLDRMDLDALRLGGALHDIGKIGVSEAILQKAEPLDPQELEIMKTHADIGYRICLPLAKNLGAALDIVRHHHEKMDGSGYPDGLSGDEIPIVARIMAVADIYNALTTNRPYRGSLSHEKANDILKKDAAAGKLDDTVVAVLNGMVQQCGIS